MVTNETSREWCSVNYTKDTDDYYISNTRSLIFKQWSKSLRHAIISLVVVILTSAFNWIEHPIAWMAAMQIGFVFYGILEYCHNDIGAGALAYICCIIFGVNMFNDSISVGAVLFYIVGFLLLFASVIPKILYHKTLGDYIKKDKQWESDEEEFEAWKRKYYNAGYNNYRENSYSGSYTYQNQYDKTTNNQKTYSHKTTTQNSRTVDPNTERARNLFMDFGTTYADLKKTYRKLAMKYHPDHGGEHDLFVAIVNEYEYIKKTRFPGEK